MRASPHSLVRAEHPGAACAGARRAAIVYAAMAISAIGLPGNVALAIGPGSQVVIESNSSAEASQEPIRHDRPAEPPPGRDETIRSIGRGTFGSAAFKMPAAGASWRNDVMGLWRQVTGVNGHRHPQAANLPTEKSRTEADVNPPIRAIFEAAADPTAIADHLQGSTTGLWRPLVMRRDSPVAEMKSPPDADSLAAADSSAMPARTEASSFLLRPFYMTNADPMDGTLGDGSRQSSLALSEEIGHDSQTSLLQSPLFAQLAFASSGELIDFNRSPAAAAGPQLVAYVQEEESSEPAEAGINSAEELIPGPPAAGAQPEEADANQGDSLAEAEQLGEEPEDRSLDFLRTETVLLEPGESQCDVGINYLLTETDFPILLADDMGNIVAVDEVSFRIRELTVPLEYRLGLHPRVQGFIGAPIGWSNTQLALDAFDAFQNDGGFGDLDFGLTMQLVDATANCPYWIGTLQATAPTGGDPFSNVVGLAPTAPSLGQGFWSIAGNLLIIQPYDPVVVFYGLGVERFFEREFVGLEIQPGAQYNYTFGVGFAVNERITLSTRFFGAYVEELEVGGQRRFGTNAEPMTIRLSATISQPCDRLVEPFVEFGITDDAVSSFLGITWTFSPKSHHSPKEETPGLAKSQ
jgi:hypothetical protein